MRSILDTAMLDGDFLAIMLRPITGLDEDLFMKEFFRRDEAAMIALKDPYELLPGTYRMPALSGCSLVRLESRISPGEMTQKWDAASEEDYEKAIGIFSERGIFFKGLSIADFHIQIANHLQQELRELRLKRIGI